MDREKIKLTNAQWKEVIYESFLIIEEKEIILVEIEDVYVESSRHTEHHNKIYKSEDGKFFRVNYEKSVKDEMGWDECNYGDTEMIEVFPIVETRIKYQ
jgi:hypothetical protein